MSKKNRSKIYPFPVERKQAKKTSPMLIAKKECTPPPLNASFIARFGTYSLDDLSVKKYDTSNIGSSSDDETRSSSRSSNDEPRGSSPLSDDVQSSDEEDIFQLEL